MVGVSGERRFACLLPCLLVRDRTDAKKPHTLQPLMAIVFVNEDIV